MFRNRRGRLAGMRRLTGLLVIALPALLVRAHEAREACREVGYAHDPFEFTGRSAAASTIIMCLPTSHSTEAFLDMLGENAVDRLDEVALACIENPDGKIADLGIPGVRRLVQTVRMMLARRRKSGENAAEAIALRTNGDLLKALERLGIVRFSPPVRNRRGAGTPAGEPNASLPDPA